MTNQPTKYPHAADTAIPELTNQLIAAIARAMLTDGESAHAITIMRHSVMQEIAEHYPWGWRSITSRRAS
jgi:hypothetical protein